MNDLLGKKIKALRSARALTQEEIAEYLGISRQKYARIENGTNNITLDILSRIASIFDVNVSEITSVLDEEKGVAYRSSENEDSSVDKMFDMLDLFYANKHLYMRLQPTSEE